MAYLARLLSAFGLIDNELEYHLLRASMAFIFLIFGYQKWFAYEAETIEPFISHSPFVFWLDPAFGVQRLSCCGQRTDRRSIINRFKQSNARSSAVVIDRRLTI
jgi:uncharacterized membrane protein YkgB